MRAFFSVWRERERERERGREREREREGVGGERESVNNAGGGTAAVMLLPAELVEGRERTELSDRRTSDRGGSTRKVSVKDK